MIDKTTVVNDLEIAKRILSNLNNPIDGMMRVRIGQVIQEAITILKMVDLPSDWSQ